VGFPKPEFWEWDYQKFKKRISKFSLEIVLLANLLFGELQLKISFLIIAFYFFKNEKSTHFQKHGLFPQQSSTRVGELKRTLFRSVLVNTFVPKSCFGTNVFTKIIIFF